VYSINGNTLELQMALMFGVIGYLFRKIDIPLAPMVLALVLGGIMEQSFRQAMTISSADPRVFVGSGICITLLVLAVVMVLLPVVLPRLRQLKAGPEDLES
jgi:putative tricarboxylic transport membrane protein